MKIDSESFHNMMMACPPEVAPFLQELWRLYQQSQEALRLMRAASYGKSSEKGKREQDPNQPLLPGLEPQGKEEPSAPETDESASSDKSTGKGGGKGGTGKGRQRTNRDSLRIDPNMPVDVIPCPMAGKDVFCPETGKKMEVIGVERTERIVFVGAHCRRQVLERLRFGVPQGEGTVVTAPLSIDLLPRCEADTTLLAHILVAKYVDHMPLYRLAERFGREGLHVSEQLLGQWVMRCGLMLEPLAAVLQTEILQSGSVHIDETPLRRLEPGKGVTATSYMWLMAARTARGVLSWWTYRKNRKAEHAETLLQGFEGLLHSDKYTAYATLAQKGAFVWCPCWAHIRRGFHNVMSGCPIAEYMLKQIGQLYLVEQACRDRSPEERLAMRQERAIPIIEDLLKWADRHIANALPKSTLGKALRYFLDLRSYVMNYCWHAAANIDNNPAERSIRPLAIGRKNWLFVGSDRAGRVTANLLSLVQSCRSCGINPEAYLEDVLRRLPHHPRDKLVQLLPHRWEPQPRQHPLPSFPAAQAQ
jgi:transposase